jgi:hypothetical protein
MTIAVAILQLRLRLNYKVLSTIVFLRLVAESASRALAITIFQLLSVATEVLVIIYNSDVDKRSSKSRQLWRQHQPPTAVAPEELGSAYNHVGHGRMHYKDTKPYIYVPFSFS